MLSIAFFNFAVFACFMFNCIIINFLILNKIVLHMISWSYDQLCGKTMYKWASWWCVGCGINPGCKLMVKQQLTQNVTFPILNLFCEECSVLDIT